MTPSGVSEESPKNIWGGQPNNKFSPQFWVIALGPETWLPDFAARWMVRFAHHDISE
jgi:hypothetical protein